ncbi:MAG: hypothetical protein AAGE89_05715 [Pseudomonadota bacterium]
MNKRLCFNLQPAQTAALKTCAIALSLILVGLTFLSTLAHAQKFEEIDARFDRLITVDPLAALGFPEGATLVGASVSERFGAISITENKKFVVLEADDPDDIPERVLITVEVQSGDGQAGDGQTGETGPETVTLLVNFNQDVRYTPGQLEVIGAQLLLLLTIAIFLEAALSVLFNWRFFQERYEGRGYKTPIAVFVSFIIVYSFNIDVLKAVLNEFGLSDSRERSSWLTQAVTAFILAGGSSLIFQLFEIFGLRAPGRRADEMRELTNRASVKVKVNRGSVPSDAQILIYANDEIIGDIAAGETRSHSRSTFVPGYPIEPGKKTIKLVAVRPGERPSSAEVEGEFTFAPRAHVTVDLAFPD